MSKNDVNVQIEKTQYLPILIGKGAKSNLGSAHIIPHSFCLQTEKINLYRNNEAKNDAVVEIGINWFLEKKLAKKYGIAFVNVC